MEPRPDTKRDLNAIRVLVADDSRIFRHFIEDILRSIPGVTIAGSVFNGEKAIDFLKTNSVDLVTLDVDMPGMSGIETLKSIRKLSYSSTSNIPPDVLLVSALTSSGSATIAEGLLAGAIDVVKKPDSSNATRNVEILRATLNEKVQMIRFRRQRQNTPTVPAPPKRTGKYSALAIGISTGGPETLAHFLPSLVKQTSAPIFIVQHILSGLSQYLADSLTKRIGKPVYEICDQRPVENHGVYLASGGKHMVIREIGGKWMVGTSDSPPENHCKPSVDVFLQSAAITMGTSLAAAILTGMGNDGSNGARAVKRYGGYVIAQDEPSSVVWGMPRCAIETGVVDEIVGIKSLSAVLAGLLLEDPKLPSRATS